MGFAGIATAKTVEALRAAQAYQAQMENDWTGVIIPDSVAVEDTLKSLVRDFEDRE